MKTQISSLSLLVCGVRPVRINIDNDSDTFTVTSPACELSSLYPDFICEVRYTLKSATELCKCLLVPVFDDDPDNPSLGLVPRLQLTELQLVVINDSERLPFAKMAIRYSPTCDLSEFDASYDSVDHVCVSVPELNVLEYFKNFKSAYDFCLYLSTPSKPSTLLQSLP